MVGELLKILTAKVSRNGNTYIRLTFKMTDGGWAKTDICPGFRNYSRWKNVLKANPATLIKGLILKRPGEINADCAPEITTEAKILTEKREKEEKEEKRADSLAQMRLI